MTTIAICVALIASIDAPITSVTVFSDQARVVRSARVTLRGPQTISVPLLRQNIDLLSIRVGAEGAEVQRVDIESSVINSSARGSNWRTLQRILVTA